MGLKDLEGKRTGRPPGARTTSRVKRDIVWAYRNLDRPDAKPPSPGARRWAEFARRKPDRFLAYVVRIETAGEKPAERKEDGHTDGERDRVGGATAKGSDGKPPQKVRKVLVDAQHLLTRLTGDGTACVSNLPRDAYVVGYEADPSRDGILLTMHSEKFPPVSEGETIPEITAVYSWRS